MNSLRNDDDDEQDSNDRELTLSTGTILAIFFALVLLCGAFFGFGYKMGNHTSIPTAQAAVVDHPPAPTTDFGSFKPAAGSPTGSSASAPVTRVASGAVAGFPSTNTSSNGAKSATAAPVVRVSPTTIAHSSPPVAVDSAPVAAGGFVVQIAAVSHQGDAELLVNALRAKGYPVSAHTEPQDKFFHVQAGPYTNRNDADLAKQRLMADGYQPIVK
jgi:DedD protein